MEWIIKKGQKMIREELNLQIKIRIFSKIKGQIQQISITLKLLQEMLDFFQKEEVLKKQQNTTTQDVTQQSPLFDPVTSQLDNRVNLKVMEIWLNETMQTAEAQTNDNLGLTNDIIKVEQKKPLNRFNVDRMTLFRSGVSQDQIDRIYRSLFVYSVGFYEMLKSAIGGQCKNRPAIISNFWKVYSILLEYCCKHDYRMQISEITEKHTEDMRNLEGQIQEKQVEFLEKEGMLKSNIQNLLNKLEEIEKERQIELQRRQQLQKDHDQQNKNYEDEINLRKRYEMKINELFILHREVETRYKRAVEEIIRIDFMKEEANQQLTISKSELDLIKKSAYQTEVKLQKAKQEEDYWKQQAEIMKEKELNREEILTKIKTEMRLAQKQINELSKKELMLKTELQSVKEKNDQLQSTIDSHLQTIDNEAKLKTNFQELTQTLKSDLMKQVELHSHCTAKIIGFQVLNKHIQKTIEEQKVEIDTKTARLDYLEQEYFSTSNKLQEFEELYGTLKRDHELAVFYAEQVKNRELQSFIEDKDRIIDKYKKDGERISNRLNQLEIAYDNLEIIKSAAAQKSILEFDELKNRNMSLETMLTSAKANRADLLNKIEDEQKQHNETIQEMNKLKLQMEDKYIENQKLQATLDNEMKKEDRWKKQVDELYEKINFYVQKKEMLEKDLNTNIQMLHVSETTAKAYFKRANEDYKMLKAQMDLKREQHEMKYEDLLSTSRELMCIIDKQKMQTHQDQTSVRIGKTMMAKLEKELYELRFAQETLEKEVKSNSTIIEEYQAQTNDLQDWNCTLEQKIKKTKEKKKSEQERYWEESKKRLGEIRELKEKVKELEEGKIGIDEEIQVLLVPQTKSVNIQTEIANDSRLQKLNPRTKESLKNVIALNSQQNPAQSNSHRSVSGRLNNHTDSALDDQSSIQDGVYQPEPQIYKKQMVKKSTHSIDEDYLQTDFNYLSQGGANKGSAQHHGKIELQLPKIGLKQGRNRQFKVMHQHNNYLSKEMQDEYGFSKLGAQTDRRSHQNDNLKQRDTSTSPTGLRQNDSEILDQMGSQGNLRESLLKKSMSNQELLKQGITSTYGMSQENMLLLKNAPRPPKIGQYDKETQKMMLGKCSLKELLKSAATRPQ
eukprot:403360026